MGNQKQKLTSIITGFLLLASVSLGVVANSAFAATTTPATINYQGRLLNSANTPLTGSYTFRFSLWSDSDFDAGDLTGAGAIDTGATGYAGWQEIHAITVGAFGLFDIDLGSTTGFPSFSDATHKYLQVEVKATGDPDTSYEVLDPNSGSSTDDRKRIHNQAYAQNADTIDNAEIGTSSGDIATIGAGDVWDISLIPSGTNQDNWTIDADDDATDPYLQFSTTGTNRLTFVNSNDWFEFNNDVNISGNITVSGTVDGVDLSNLSFSDLSTRVKEWVFTPEFPNYTVEPDGTSNRGKLVSEFEDLGGTGKRNYYEWTTQQAGQNDMDIVVSFKLPLDFVSFTGTPLEINYQTLSGSTAVNKVDVEVYDTTGSAVSLTGGSDLANATWATENITFGGSPTFTAGDVMTLKIKLSSTNAGFARISNMTLNYNGR